MADGNDPRDETIDMTESDAQARTDDPQQLSAQLDAARAEAQMYKDKYLREYAEKENFRRSQERRAEDRVRRAKRAVLEHVLEIVDNLDRALVYEETMDQNSLRQTLRMLQAQLNGMLSAEGLTPVATVGEPFDPYVHEAIETVSSREHPEGVVAEEVRRGYKQGDELLRPARVKVSAGPDA